MDFKKFINLTGNGNFGSWSTDEFGFPIYEFTQEQIKKSPAVPTTSSRVSNSMLHQVGNDRLTCIANSKGFIDVFIGDRGLESLTANEDKFNTILPFGALILKTDQNLILNDLPYSNDLEKEKRYKLSFGLGYITKSFLQENITLKHSIRTPFGNDPVILSNVYVKNESINSKTFKLYFNCNYKHYNMIASLFSLFYINKIRNFFFQSKLLNFLIKPFKNFILMLNLGGEQVRVKFRKNFNTQLSILGDKSWCIERKYKKRKKINEQKISDRNYYPYPIYVAPLTTSINCSMKEFRYDLKKKRIKVKSLSKITNSTNLVMECSFKLNPGEIQNIGFMICIADKIEAENLIIKYRKQSIDSIIIASCNEWRKNLINLHDSTFQWLQREISWHSYYLRSSLVYEKYFNQHIFLQGSAYTFKSGINGAIRDYVFFLQPIILTDPVIAREILIYILKNMHVNGKLPYANHGYGNQTGAFVHETSSDIYLFFLWGIIEFIYTTRNYKFLDEKVKFYPKTKLSSTVFERIELTLKYLIENIGFGSHGMLKVGSGDWSDVITMFAKNRKKFIKNGESSFNTGLALFVFPKILPLLEGRGSKLADIVKEKILLMKKSLDLLWNNKWLVRGLEPPDLPIGEDQIFLDHHPWFILSNMLSDRKSKSIINHIYKILDDPCIPGNLILYPPIKTFLNIFPMGWDVNGGIWHAINFLLTWAYAQNNPELALHSLLKSTMCWRAENYPNIWYGIISGPDAYNAPYAINDGQTFIHPATPQVDFPSMNMNLHANILNSIIKSYMGITTDFNKIKFKPICMNDFAFKTNLISVSKDKNRIFCEINVLEYYEFKIEFVLDEFKNKRIELKINDKKINNYNLLDNKLQFLSEIKDLKMIFELEFF